jgi:hypothetical protein
MVASLPAPGVTVVRLRLRDPTGDPYRAGTHTGRLLAGASLRPSLPPAAVLVVRRLHDPAPGTVRADAGQAMLPPAWEQAVSTTLDRVALRAARPAREPVPTEADAVLFADRAELLACLARDWRGGTVGVRWWWRGLVAGVDPAAAVTRAWLDAPRHVPAALELLAGWGEATRFAGALDPELAGRLAGAVAVAFGLEEPAAGAERALLGPAEDRSRGGRAPPPPAAEPWQTVVPEAGATALTLQQRRLLGLGLAIRRDLPALRASRIARAGGDWRAAAATRPPTRQGPKGGPSRSAGGRPGAAGRPGGAAAGPSGRATPGASAGPSAPVTVRAPQPGRPPAGSPTPPGPTGERAGSAAAPVPTTWSPPPPAPRGAARGPSTRPGPAAGRLTRRESSRNPSAAPDLGPAALPGPIPGLEPVPGPTGRPVAAAGSGTGTAGLDPGLAAPRTGGPRPAPDELGETVDTGLAGLFYLLNVGLYLELYGDFTTPGQPGIPLDPWDFVTLLGRHLLAEPVPDDPIWATLARLAGRGEDEPPGAGFTPPPVWRLPPTWLVPFDDDDRPWRWSAAAGRLRAEHPAGFLLLDVAAEACGPVVQARHELAPYRPRRAARRGRVRPEGATAPDLHRWVDRLGAYVSARLLLALGLQDQRLLPTVLLRRQARVLSSRTQVDVVFRLDELPIQVRLAGLDRDPGWVPAAGRAVAFHFR